MTCNTAAAIVASMALMAPITSPMIALAQTNAEKPATVSTPMEGAGTAGEHTNEKMMKKGSAAKHAMKTQKKHM